MLEVTQQLAKFVADLRYEDIPAEVIDRAKLLMCDLVGIGVRARHEADSTLAMMRATEVLGADGGTCGVFGDTGWFSPAAAASCPSYWIGFQIRCRIGLDIGQYVTLSEPIYTIWHINNTV